MKNKMHQFIVVSILLLVAASPAAVFAAVESMRAIEKSRVDPVFLIDEIENARRIAAAVMAGALAVALANRMYCRNNPAATRDVVTIPEATDKLDKLPAKALSAEAAAAADAQAQKNTENDAEIGCLEYPLVGDFGSVVSPDILLRILKRAYPDAGLDITPAVNFGLTSIPGNNTYNHDYALSFKMPANSTEAEAIRWIFIADGAGDSHGALPAAYTAITTAARAVISSKKTLMPPQVLQAAFVHAARAVEIKARDFPLGTFSTTLIILAISKTDYFGGHIGDGGVLLRRKNGDWLSLLKPQHSPIRSNLLLAFLGAKQQGVPQYFNAVREVGDFVVLGSDGVFIEAHDDNGAPTPAIDHERLWKFALDQNFAGNVSLQQNLDVFLPKLAANYPQAFDDNLTACLIVTPQMDMDIGGSDVRPT